MRYQKRCSTLRRVSQSIHASCSTTQTSTLGSIKFIPMQKVNVLLHIGEMILLRSA